MKEMLAVMCLDFHGAHALRAPLPIKILLPTEPEKAERIIVAAPAPQPEDAGKYRKSVEINDPAFAFKWKLLNYP